MAAETYASATIPSALTEVESLKFQLAAKSVEAHNAQVAALQQSIQAAQTKLEQLNAGAPALQAYFNNTVKEIGDAHTDLQYNGQGFVPKPVAVPQAAAAAAPSTDTVQ